MRAYVVFESLFGNTQAVARAIADGLAAGLEVEIAEVGAAPLAVDDLALLVVGAPTHAFGMSRPGTRKDASQRAGGSVVSRGDGIREWLASLPADGHATPAATFDTRIDKPRVPGSAARAAERRLRRLGFTIAAPAESFFVSDVAGPLLDGELDRARRWGERLAAGVGMGARHPQPL